MTIPDDALHRAAILAAEAETENIIERCTCDTCMEQRTAGLRAALPILQTAILESIIADVDTRKVFFGSPMFPYDITEELAAFLRAYLPESEPKP